MFSIYKKTYSEIVLILILLEIIIIIRVPQLCLLPRSHAIIMDSPSMASIYATNCGHIYCIHFSMEDNRHRDSVEFGCRWWPIEIIYFYEKFTRTYCDVQLTRPELNWTDADGRYFLSYVHIVINCIYVVSPIWWPAPLSKTLRFPTYFYNDESWNNIYIFC